MVFVVGLDGGWSKTAGVLCDERGTIRAQVRARGSAIVGLPSPDIKALLDGLVSRLCQDAGVRRSELAHIGLGLSGVDYADEAVEQHADLARGLQVAAGNLTLVNDGLAALWGVSADARVALVQHGSGVTTAYRPEVGHERIYDSLDIAAMYDIRRESFARTARMLDGRLPRSLLADLILEHCGVSEERFAEWAYRDPEAKAYRFSTAKVVFGAWAQGDPNADEMVRLAAADYVLATRAMGALMGPGAFAAAFGGGVITEGGARFAEVIHRLLEQACPEAKPAPIRLPPEHGAALLAASRMGLSTSSVFEGLAAGVSLETLA